MMKIAILTDHFPPMKGGISRYVEELSKNWLKAGVDLIIVSTVKNHNEFSNYFIPEQNYFFIPKKKQTYLASLRVFLKFLKIFKNSRSEIVFLPVWNPYAIFMMFAKFFMPGMFNYVVAAHAADILAIYPNSSLTVYPIFKKLGRKALQCTDKIFTVSRFTGEELTKLGVSPNKIKVFPNGVDSQFFKPISFNRRTFLEQYGIKNFQRPLLLTVAQLNVRKGIDTAIRIVYELRDENIFVNYIIIGKGEDENRLRELIEKYQLNDQVFIFTGIEDKELVRFYNVCDLFLLLSRHVGDLNVEGFGIVLLEANACQKPVIAGNSGGIPDAVEDGITGYLVDPNNSQEIMKKIKDLLLNPQKKNEMGKNARLKMLSKYNWSIIAQNMVQEFRSIKTK